MLPGMRARRPVRTALWMAAYVACFVLVLSFIFFEVLDVDGSDFERLARTATIQVVDPPQDLRRAPLHVSVTWQATPYIGRTCADTLHAPRALAGVRVDTPAQPELRRASRLTFARALLADPAPSA